MVLKTIAAIFGGATLGAAATYGFLMAAAPYMTDVDCVAYETPAGRATIPVCAGMDLRQSGVVVGSGFLIGGVTAGLAVALRRRKDDPAPRA